MPDFHYTRNQTMQLNFMPHAAGSCNTQDSLQKRHTGNTVTAARACNRFPCVCRPSGPVIRKPVNAIPGLKVTRSINFSSKNIPHLRSCFVRYEITKARMRRINNISRNLIFKFSRCKTQIIIFTNPGLAQSGFEQPGLEQYFNSEYCHIL